MFVVLFEARCRPSARNEYLQSSDELRATLGNRPGFLREQCLHSLRRKDWFLSLSEWQDEKALVRWRVDERHHQVQQRSRASHLLDYHVRVSELVADTQLPDGESLKQQRFDATQSGRGPVGTLLSVQRSRNKPQESPIDIANRVGLEPFSAGCVAWDVYENVRDANDIVLLAYWPDRDAAQHFGSQVDLSGGNRFRQLRILRDYGMFDRREAPQYFPEVTDERGHVVS
jgi:heme-degrading monooxygenase HmoA